MNWFKSRFSPRTTFSELEVMSPLEKGFLSLSIIHLFIKTHPFLSERCEDKLFGLTGNEFPLILQRDICHLGGNTCASGLFAMLTFKLLGSLQLLPQFAVQRRSLRKAEPTFLSFPKRQSRFPPKRISSSALFQFFKTESASICPKHARTLCHSPSI